MKYLQYITEDHILQVCKKFPQINQKKFKLLVENVSIRKKHLQKKAQIANIKTPLKLSLL